MNHHVLGIRHHGPGSARSVLAALRALEPDVLLIEGPPEGERVLPLALDPGMIPPVALLLYRPDRPRRAAFYPFATFSPEWQALRYGLQRGIPVRFMDLPAAHDFALRDDPEPVDPVRADPLRLLAEAAGYQDSERWWEHMVEARRDPEGLFQALTEAMAALRAEVEPEPPLREALREAWMRRVLREVAKAGAQRTAVICGAWHAPALVDLPTAKSDADLLKGLPRVKVQATWIPWTHDRLAHASGYGAGVESPGYYEHLWTASDEVAASWMTRVTHLLRDRGLDASPAQAVDAVRLAEALAALRGRALPDLEDLTEAATAALGGGSPMALELIRSRLVVGERLGQVPPDTPGVPLQEDLRATCRRLRLQPSAEDRDLELDLRKPGDRERSLLLHRLRALEVPWGSSRAIEGALGTFREAWRLHWDPMFQLRLVEAGRWGSTLEEAASGALVERAGKLRDLAALTGILEEALLAGLPETTATVLDRVRELAAVAGDVTVLMEALPPLARTLRYSSVRRPDAAALRALVDGLAARIAVGLPDACASLSDEAAEEMRDRLEAVHGSLLLFPEAEIRAAWLAALGQVARRPPTPAGRVHGLVAGRCARLLRDAGSWSPEEASLGLARALSPGAEPRFGASWLEGFLRGSGLVLLHDRQLWHLVDEWITGLARERFEEVLPLLRRTFSQFPPPERRLLGQRLAAPSAAVEVQEELEADRADAVIPVAARLLGLGLGT